MFLGQVEDEIGLNNPGSIHGDESIAAEIARKKFEMKYNAQYKDVGKKGPPGVLVEENKRRKILNALGVEMRSNQNNVGTADKKEEAEEAKNEEIQPISEATAELTR
jgi:hypothetical protein